METKKFRKKPVVIEAIRYEDDSPAELQRVQEFTGIDPLRVDYVNKETYGAVIIPTLEGEMRANIGDFIIKGIGGEFYPCKPDIFWNSYEEI